MWHLCKARAPGPVITCWKLRDGRFAAKLACPASNSRLLWPTAVSGSAKMQLSRTRPICNHERWSRPIINDPNKRLFRSHKIVLRDSCFSLRDMICFYVPGNSSGERGLGPKELSLEPYMKYSLSWKLPPKPNKPIWGTASLQKRLLPPVSRLNFHPPQL